MVVVVRIEQLNTFITAALLSKGILNPAALVEEVKPTQGE